MKAHENVDHVWNDYNAYSPLTHFLFAEYEDAIEAKGGRNLP